MMRSSTLVLVVLFPLAGCGSVDVPEEHLYRMAYPTPSAGYLGRAGVLRVEGLELATHLIGDRLLVADGPVAVRPYRFHRWAGSVDGLVGDALRAGLARSRAFAQVKGPRDPGSAALVLTGRVLELCQVADDGQWAARTALELTLVDGARGSVVFSEEFRSDVVLPDGEPESLVRGISEGIAQIVDRVVTRSEAAGLFARELESTPPK